MMKITNLRTMYFELRFYLNHVILFLLFQIFETHVTSFFRYMYEILISELYVLARIYFVTDGENYFVMEGENVCQVNCLLLTNI